MNESIPLLIDVVKDDVNRRNKVAAVLEQLGFEVRKHADATSFYRATLLRRADVAVLDVDLPGEGGVSIAGHMRAVGELGLILLSTRDGSVPRESSESMPGIGPACKCRRRNTWATVPPAKAASRPRPSSRSTDA